MRKLFLQKLLTGIFLFGVCACGAYTQNVSVGSVATANGTWNYADGTYTFTPTADAYVNVADIRTRMESGAAPDPAGNVLIIAQGNIITNNSVEVRHNTATPAYTMTWQAGGDVLTSNYIGFISQNGFNAHSIVFEAQGNIVINASGSAESIKTCGEGSTTNGTASGGDITLRAEGNITMQNGARCYTFGVGSNNDGQDGGNGGNVLIECAGTFTGSTDGINTRGEAGKGNSNGGKGGNITITAGKVDMGNKAFYFTANGGTGRGTDGIKKGGNGGDITITSTSGNIIFGTGSFFASGGVGENGQAGGNGGNITVNAADSLIITNNGNGFNNYGNSGALNNGGNGGNITINASTIKITSNFGFFNYGGAGRGEGSNGGNGGDISMHTTGNIDITGNKEWGVYGGSGENNSSAGNGGNVSLIADNGYVLKSQNTINISANAANSAGLRGNGGNFYAFGETGVTLYGTINAAAGGGGTAGTEIPGNITIGTNNSTVTTGNTTTNSGLNATTTAGNLIKTGAGTIAIPNNTSITGTTTIKGGLLLIKNASSIPSNKDVILDGGYLQSTVSKTWTGKLRLTANGGGIWFDGTATPELKFPAYTADDWASTGVFTVKNWKNEAGQSGTKGKLFIGTNATDLPADQIAQTQFLQVPLPALTDYAAQQLATGEIVPYRILLQGNECSGQDYVAITPMEGVAFTVGYTYSFSTSGTTVHLDFKLLDDRTGVVAYYRRYNTSTGGGMMGGDNGMTITDGVASADIADLTVGTDIYIAVKWAFAGGMSVTKIFTYTVGETCIIDDIAPVMGEASVVEGSATDNSVTVNVAATDDITDPVTKFVVIIDMDSVLYTATETDGQWQITVNGLDPNTSYGNVRIRAVDDFGNVSENHVEIGIQTTDIIVPVNTECSGTETEKLGYDDGADFIVGYKYNFSTTGTTVHIRFELLDEREGVVSYLWQYNGSDYTSDMNQISSTTSAINSYDLTDQTVGNDIYIAAKWAFAGGMSVTKIFTYTVGEKCITMPTNTEEQKDNKLVVFVNNGQLTIDNYTGGATQIFDLMGKTIHHSIINNSIDVSNLASGIYFLRIDNQTIKFLKD